MTSINESLKDTIAEIESGLADLTNRLEELNERAINRVQDSSSSLSRQSKDMLDRLAVKKLVLEEKIQSMKAASENASEDLKVGVAIAWHDLKDAFESARTRFLS